MRAFPNGRLLGWYFGGEGGCGGIWVTGSSGPGRGVATHGTVDSMVGDVGAGAGAGGTMMVGGSSVDKGNSPDIRCADSICPYPHADFLLASLALFRSALSVSTNSLSLSMFPYFE